MDILKDNLKPETYEQVMNELKAIDSLKGKLRLVNAADGSWIPKDTYTAALDEVKTLKQTDAEQKKRLEAVDSELETLKNSSSDTKLQEEIQKLQAERKKEQEAAKAREEQLQKEAKERTESFVLKNALEKLDALDAVSVIPHLDKEKLVFKDDAVYGLEDQVTPLKGEKPHLFKPVEGDPGGSPNPSNPNPKEPDWDKMSDEEFFAKREAGDKPN